MPRPMPRSLPQTPFQWAILPLLVLFGWGWDVSVRTWNEAPSRVSRALSAESSLMRPEDLPEDGLARVLARHGHGVDETVTTALFPHEGALERPLIEAVLSRRVDEQTRLLLWLNLVPMGHRGDEPVTGLDEAARAWFGKRCEELAPEELEVLLDLVDEPWLRVGDEIARTPSSWLASASRRL